MLLYQYMYLGFTHTGLVKRATVGVFVTQSFLPTTYWLDSCAVQRYSRFIKIMVGSKKDLAVHFSALPLNNIRPYIEK